MKYRVPQNIVSLKSLSICIWRMHTWNGKFTSSSRAYAHTLKSTKTHIRDANNFTLKTSLLSNDSNILKKCFPHVHKHNNFTFKTMLLSKHSQNIFHSLIKPISNSTFISTLTIHHQKISPEPQQLLWKMKNCRSCFDIWNWFFTPLHKQVKKIIHRILPITFILHEAKLPFCARLYTCRNFISQHKNTTFFLCESARIWPQNATLSADYFKDSATPLKSGTQLLHSAMQFRREMPQTCSVIASYLHNAGCKFATNHTQHLIKSTDK